MDRMKDFLIGFVVGAVLINAGIFCYQLNKRVSNIEIFLKKMIQTAEARQQNNLPQKIEGKK
jgi:hypothetical protein